MKNKMTKLGEEAKKIAKRTVAVTKKLKRATRKTKIKQYKRYLDNTLKSLFCTKTENKPAHINLVSRFKTNSDTVKPTINNKQPQLLLDSGAEVSLLKSKIVTGMKINEKDNLVLSGIGKGEIYTRGSVTLEIEFESDFKITHKIHVVPDDFPIVEDGIIGRDFFEKHKADIKYSSNTIQIGTKQTPFSNGTTNSMTLPARSETIIEIKTTTNQACLCKAFEVETGVFIPHTLIQPIDYKAKILVANTLNQDIQIHDIQPTFEPWQPDQQSQIAINSTAVDDDREARIIKTITEKVKT